MRVAATEPITDDGLVRRIDLVSAQGGPLPSYVPGGHVVVRCGDRHNAYSLIGHPRAPDVYSCAVLRVGAGSTWLQERAVGDEIEIEPPRNTMAPRLSARRFLLVAGGIGITPMLSLARSATVPVEAHVVHARGRAALVDRLSAACDVTAGTSRADFVQGVNCALTRQPLGTHLYVCGPPAMIDAVLSAARIRGWPESRLHTEAFVAARRPSRSFRVTLARSGTTLTVGADESLLDALDAAEIPVDRLCRHGVCGRCRTRVLGGDVDHRDLVLTDGERAQGNSMMACVSRAAGDGVEVDL